MFTHLDGIIIYTILTTYQIHLFGISTHLLTTLGTLDLFGGIIGIITGGIITMDSIIGIITDSIIGIMDGIIIGEDSIIGIIMGGIMVGMDVTGIHIIIIGQINIIIYGVITTI
jgi:hypothetical protein